MAPCAHGGERCRRVRHQGNFCKQHWLEYRDKDRKNDLWEDLTTTFADACSSWDDEQMQLACARSLEDNADLEKYFSESRQLLNERLKSKGLQPLDTPHDGSCLFVSLCFSAGLALDHSKLREEIVAYLPKFASEFKHWFDNHFQSYEAYLAHMARESTYGEDWCVQAAAHLMMRPVHVLSDMEDHAYSESVFTPPASIAEAAWGSPVVVVCYVKGRHYEATCSLDALGAGEPVCKKRLNPEIRD